MHLTTLQRFASSERIVLFVLCFAVVFVDSLIWFGATNYYSEYEGFLSRLTRFNFGSNDNPVWFDMYSPVGYFMYERLWGFLNSLNHEFPWYDITMWLLFMLSKLVLVIAFWIGTENTENKQGKKLWIWAICVGLLVHIPFHWIIRIQNHTHIAYMVCFSFAILLVQLFRRATPDSIMVLLSSIGFMLGAFLRWEVGFIVASVLFAYVFVQDGLLALLRYKAVFIMFGTFVAYVSISYATDGAFYRQIEPNGEYVVLYAKSVNAPIGSSEDVQLRYDMLNNWMLDDTTFVSLDFFKSAVDGGRLLIRVYDVSLWNVVGSVFGKIVLSPQSLGMILMIGLCLLSGFDYRVILFIASVYAMMSILNLASLLNDRHFINIISGVLILIASSRLNGLLRNYLTGSVIVLCVAVVLTVKLTETEIDFYHERECSKVIFADRVSQFLGTEVLYTDGQYDVLVSNRLFEDSMLLNNVVFLSLQQYSYSDFFDEYLRAKVGVGYGNYGAIYGAICKTKGYAYLLISESRLALLKRVLSFEGCDLKFETIVSCGVDCFEKGDPFSGVSLQKLTFLKPADETVNMVFSEHFACSSVSSSR